MPHVDRCCLVLLSFSVTPFPMQATVYFSEGGNDLALEPITQHLYFSLHRLGTALKTMEPHHQLHSRLSPE